MSPEFDSETTEYTATTANATDKITAEADEGVTIAITVNDVELENEGDATWTDGENTVVVTASKDGTTTTTYTVTVTKVTYSKLTDLTIGSLTLSPTFDADVTAYTTTTSNASNKVTATAAEGVTIAITVNGDALENEASATWETGENTVVVTASAAGTETTTYTVTVTKE